MLERPWALKEEENFEKEKEDQDVGVVTRGPVKSLQIQYHRDTHVILRHRRAVPIFAEGSEHDEERQGLILVSLN